jgi:hypothetical protein
MQNSPSSEANRSKLVKKFPAFYGTRKFITILTYTHKCPPPVPILSQLDPVHNPHIPLPEDSSYYYPPIYMYACVSQVVSFLQICPPKPVHTSSVPLTYYMPRPSHSSRFDPPNSVGWGVYKLHTVFKNRYNSAPRRDPPAVSDTKQYVHQCGRS